MKKFILWAIFSFILFNLPSLKPQDMNLSLIEEDRYLWDNILQDKSIKNKNLLYASYVAYKDRLNDLSIETFQECINTNQGNDIVKGIGNYYIGKNLFFTGKYEEALIQFKIIKNINLAQFNDIKYAALINTAITYHSLNNIEKFRENIQKVISTDKKGRFKKIALDILTKLK